MFRKVISIALIAILGAVSGSRAIAGPQSPAPTGVTTVEDKAAGWTWSGMDEILDDNLSGGSGRAGGIGSYGVYTFQGAKIKVYALAGPSVVVSGRAHKMGSLRVLIDGAEKANVKMSQPEAEFGKMVCSVDGLGSGNHVVQVEAQGGWAAVDKIEIFTSDKPSADKPTHSSKERVAIFDPLDNLNSAWRKSERWTIDTMNISVIGGDPSRATRSLDDKEFMAYHVTNLTGFLVRVFSKAPVASLANTVQLYYSTDGGQTTQTLPYAILNSFAGGTSGDWTGYDLSIKDALPPGIDTFYVTFNPGSGQSWDPQLSQISLMTK